MTDTLHTCSYYCHVPACIKAQRDELREKLFAPPLTCIWTEHADDYMPGTWASACGELWSFIDGGPAENNVRFCHGCGKPVEVHSITKDSHEVQA